MEDKTTKFTTAELEQNGYHKFFDRQKTEDRWKDEKNPLLLGRTPSPHPYKGTWQKCIRDTKGKKYFINLEFWDFSDSEYKALIKDGPSFQADAQLRTSTGNNFNLTLIKCANLTLAEVEAWFDLQWTTNGSNYYEEDVIHE